VPGSRDMHNASDSIGERPARQTRLSPGLIQRLLGLGPEAPDTTGIAGSHR